jgi:hypothetical protein
MASGLAGRPARRPTLRPGAFLDQLAAYGVESTALVVRNLVSLCSLIYAFELSRLDEGVKPPICFLYLTRDHWLFVGDQRESACGFRFSILLTHHQPRRRQDAFFEQRRTSYRNALKSPSSSSKVGSRRYLACMEPS